MCLTIAYWGASVALAAVEIRIGRKTLAKPSIALRASLSYTHLVNPRHVR
jgi:hypothetical protein